MPKALGLIETKGLVAAIEAADAMLKAANVAFAGKTIIRPALVTIKVVGDTAAVRSAVDAGSAAASRIGHVVSTHVIPQPDEQLISMLPEIDDSTPHSSAKRVAVSEEIITEEKTSPDTVSRLKKEAITRGKSTGAENIDEIDSMNVHQLRHLARSISEFPIKGREISKANREELLRYFRSLK
jgi:microcompartment protein CcmL/EutN